MARRGLWTPARNWTPSEWVPLQEAVSRIEDYIGGELWQAWAVTISELQQHLDGGKALRSSALLRPEQGGPANVILNKAFWRRYRLKGIATRLSGAATKYSVRLHDTVEDKRVRVPKDMRIYLCAADLDRLYLGPMAKARDVEPQPNALEACTEGTAAAPNERELSPKQQILLEEIEVACGARYARKGTGEIMRDVAKNRGRNGEPLPSRDMFLRALRRRKG
jgi:hypothetical protein